MKKYFFISILLILASMSVAHADTSASSGFIPDQIWYSKNPLVEGDTVKVYTALWNGDSTPLSAHVEFYDSTVLLGARDATVAPGDITDVFITWKVTAGDHSISAKISSSSTTADGKKEAVTLDNTTTSENKTFVQAKAAANDAIKDGITKATEAVQNISLPTPIASSLSAVDTYRADTYASILDTKTQTQKQIDAMNGVPTKSSPAPTTTKDKNAKTAPKVEQTPSKPLDATEKPIANVKLFLFTILGFIFGTKIVFYGIIALIVFLVLRFIYRKIRHK